MAFDRLYGEPIIGSSIESAANDACHVATSSGIQVAFVFNETPILVEPNEMPSAVIARYWKQRDKPTMDAETKYVIYSREHNAWWRAASAGYTRIPAQAGLYTLEEAFRIVNDANEFINPDNGPNEFAYSVLSTIDFVAGG